MEHTLMQKLAGFSQITPNAADFWPSAIGFSNWTYFTPTTSSHKHWGHGDLPVRRPSTLRVFALYVSCLLDSLRTAYVEYGARPSVPNDLATAILTYWTIFGWSRLVANIYC